ncbi:MAG: YciI family protein [Fimbriimonadaceae bacterium]|nr:YciI family protein [Fimbriimonadaceae bacterium]
MRFLMLMIPAVYQGPEGNNPEFDPPPGLVEKMMKYNEDLANAGMVIAMDGLQPMAKGGRVSFSGGKGTITDGPFVEAKEVVGGFWIIRANSKEEALEWAARCPAQDGDVVEVRQIFDMDDYPEEVQKVVDSSPLKETMLSEGPQ